MSNFTYDFDTFDKLYVMWMNDQDSVECLKDGKRLEQVENLGYEVGKDGRYSFKAFLYCTHWLTGEKLETNPDESAYLYQYETIHDVEVRRRQSDTDMYEWFLNHKPVPESKDIEPIVAEKSAVFTFVNEWILPVRMAVLTVDGQVFEGHHKLVAWERQNERCLIHTVEVVGPIKSPRVISVERPAFNLLQNVNNDYEFTLYAGKGSAWMQWAPSYIRMVSHHICGPIEKR